jgi:hypothetical protein
MLSTALEQRRAVRVLLMRGTIHLVTAEDAPLLRAVVQPALDRMVRTSQVSRPAADVPSEALRAAVQDAVAAVPRPVKELGEHLATVFPDVPPAALADAARQTVPLVQVPPRGLWRRSGGVTYQTLDGWLGPTPEAVPDLTEVVRRYLRAFGPAGAADVTTWSGVTGVRAAFEELSDELVVHRDEHGRRLVDLEGLPLADPDVPAPVRLLGRYDNLWLSHQHRDRVTPDPGKRKQWMGVNGGVACTVFVDGELEGLWRETPSGRLDVRMFRPLTSAEQADLDTEVGRVEDVLRAPAAELSGGGSAGTG